MRQLLSNHRHQTMRISVRHSQTGNVCDNLGVFRFMENATTTKYSAFHRLD